MFSTQFVYAVEKKSQKIRKAIKNIVNELTLV